MSSTIRPSPGRAGSILVGVILIGLGVLFLAINFLSITLNVNLVARLWPTIFFIGALIFYVPALAAGENRRELAGLFVPGTILLTLGLIFLYNTFTGDWGSWAYAWTLIPAGVGLGIALGAVFGGWGRNAITTGLAMAAISVGAFAFFASLFGGFLLKVLGPTLIILLGLLLLVRALWPR